MKIRALLAGMVFVLAAGGCAAEAVLPDAATPVPGFDGSAPPDTAANRGGGPLGSGT